MSRLIEAQCQSCKHRQEIFVKKLVGFGEPLSEEDKEIICDLCGAKETLKRLPNGHGIEYKTTGFYTTDYGGKRG